jgi:hypothetical protein
MFITHIFSVLLLFEIYIHRMGMPDIFPKA